MSAPSASAPAVSETRINALLRHLDWRFLLRVDEAPRYCDLSGGRYAEALALIGEDIGPASGEADLAVLGFPTAKGLTAARGVLLGGGEVACLWRSPRVLGPARARRRLRRAGFVDVRLYAPWRGRGQPPEMWLPLGAAAVRETALAGLPPRSRRDALARRAWPHLGPVCALARLPAKSGVGNDPEPSGEGLPDPEAWVLLTGGPESDAKVVGLPHDVSGRAGSVVVKFARVAKADRALEREAEVLRTLERERPELAGVPRLRASGRRAGGVAIAQDAVRGQALSTAIAREGLSSIAAAVTEWLAALAGRSAPQPPGSWAKRLVLAPLTELESLSVALVPAELAPRVRRQLADLGELPLVPEHRDFGPWNIVIDAAGAPAAIDWEDAELRGLPGLDLAYFLASASFELGGGLDPAERIEAARERNRRLLNPGTEEGGIATRCVERYCSAVGVEKDDFGRLRLLCWLVQALIALRRLPAGAVGATPAASDAELFLALAQDELQRLESQQ